MNPISAGRNPSSASVFREMYLSSLALDISNMTKNLNANRLYQSTGSSGAEPADTRTVTEKYADFDRLKIELRNTLRQITDGMEAEKIVQGLAEQELKFLSGQIDFVISDIKPRWKMGIPATAFIPYLRKLMRKYIETTGVDYGLQQPTGGGGGAPGAGGMPVPNGNNLGLAGDWRGVLEVIDAMLGGNPVSGDFRYGFGDAPRMMNMGVSGNPAADYNPSGRLEMVRMGENPYSRPSASSQRASVNAPRKAIAAELLEDNIRAKSSTGPSASASMIKRTQQYLPSQFNEPIGYTVPRPAVPKISAAEKIGLINLRKRIEKIIELLPDPTDFINVSETGNLPLITAFENANIEMAQFMPTRRNIHAMRDGLLEAYRTRDANFVSSHFNNILAIIDDIDLMVLRSLKTYGEEAKKILIRRGEEPAGYVEEVDYLEIEDDEAAASELAQMETKMLPPPIPFSSEESKSEEIMYDEKEGPEMGAVDGNAYWADLVADYRGIFPGPGQEIDDRNVFPTPEQFNKITDMDVIEWIFSGLKDLQQFTSDTSSYSGEIQEVINKGYRATDADIGQLHRIYQELIESVLGSPAPAGLPPSPVKELPQALPEAGFPETTAFDMLSTQQKLAVFEKINREVRMNGLGLSASEVERIRNYIDDPENIDEVVPDPRTGTSLPIDNWLNKSYRKVVNKLPLPKAQAVKEYEASQSFSTPIKNNPNQVTISPTKGNGVRGRPKKSKNIIMGCGLATTNSAPIDNVNWDEGIKPEPTYAPFGKHFINKFRLKDDVLMLRTAKGGAIMSVPTQRVSKNLSRVFKKLIGGSIPTFDELSDLGDDDKDLLFKISKTSKIGDRLSVPNPNKSKIEQEDNRFEILRGQIASGQDNKDAIKEFKMLLIKMMNSGRIPKGQAIDILTELTALGH